MNKDCLGKLSIPISILALIMSVLPIYFSYFWHSEKMSIYIADATFDKGSIKTKIILSNLGNRDEVMYSASYGYYTNGMIDYGKESKVLIVKDGDSVKFDLIDEPKIKPENRTTKLSLIFDFKSIKELVYMEFGCIDNKANKLYYTRSELELSNVHRSSKETCNTDDYDSVITLEYDENI